MKNIIFEATNFLKQKLLFLFMFSLFRCIVCGTDIPILTKFSSIKADNSFQIYDYFYCFNEERKFYISIGKTKKSYANLDLMNPSHFILPVVKDVIQKCSNIVKVSFIATICLARSIF